MVGQALIARQRRDAVNPQSCLTNGNWGNWARNWGNQFPQLIITPILFAREIKGLRIGEGYLGNWAAILESPIFPQFPIQNEKGAEAPSLVAWCRLQVDSLCSLPLAIGPWSLHNSHHRRFASINTRCHLSRAFLWRSDDNLHQP